MLISQTINNLVNELNPRQREIISGRFGFNPENEKYTLAKLGEKYDITRERVRQIETEAIKSIKEEIEEKEIERMLEPIKDYLVGLGGARREDLLINDLREGFKDDYLNDGHLLFLSEIAERPEQYISDEKYHQFWHSGRTVLKIIHNFIHYLEKMIARRGGKVISQEELDSIIAQAVKPHRLSNDIGLNYISLSKKFGNNPYGDFGLSHWEEIYPKTMRSKAYLVVKKHGAPLHFREIAEMINKMKFDERVAHPQTVHNELIKEPRFVLVGRGLYGLQEHGFSPAATPELMIKILKKEGPLPPKELAEEVLRQRKLKENTIFLYLHNKKHFKRLADGRYYIK